MNLSPEVRKDVALRLLSMVTSFSDGESDEAGGDDDRPVDREASCSEWVTRRRCVLGHEVVEAAEIQSPQRGRNEGGGGVVL